MPLNSLIPPIVNRDSFRAFQYGSQVNTEVSKLSGKHIAILSLGENSPNLNDSLYKLCTNFKTFCFTNLGTIPEDPNLLFLILEQLYQMQVPTCIIGQAAWIIEVQQKVANLHHSQTNISILTANYPFPEQPQLPQWEQAPQEAYLLGYQSYFLDPELLTWLKKQNWELYRLGNLRNQWAEIEPSLRNNHWACFHSSALKAADAPAQKIPNPSGMTAEEACLCARYIGMSDQLNLWSILGFDWTLDQQNLTAQVLAQMIWYWVEGIEARKSEANPTPQQLQEFNAVLKGYEDIISFFQSPRSERWWFKFKDQNKLEPCSYLDFKLAQQGEISNRIWEKLQK